MHKKRSQAKNAQRPKVKDSGMDSLIAAAWDAGWWCERGGNNHIKCFPPDDGRMVLVASTPSDRRAYQNTRSLFRQNGLEV